MMPLCGFCFYVRPGVPVPNAHVDPYPRLTNREWHAQRTRASAANGFMTVISSIFRRIEERVGHAPALQDFDHFKVGFSYAAVRA
jgi:hypothetical protein